MKDKKKEKIEKLMEISWTSPEGYIVPESKQDGLTKQVTKMNNKINEIIERLNNET